jgi:hypothetical protein
VPPRCHALILILDVMPTHKHKLKPDMLTLHSFMLAVAAVPFALPNTVSATSSGYSGWAAGIRAPAITVALSGGWAEATLEGWTMGLPALFPQA